MGSAWGPHGFCWPQMGPMLAPWTLLSGLSYSFRPEGRRATGPDLQNGYLQNRSTDYFRSKFRRVTVESFVPLRIRPIRAYSWAKTLSTLVRVRSRFMFGRTPIFESVEVIFSVLSLFTLWTPCIITLGPSQHPNGQIINAINAKYLHINVIACQLRYLLWHDNEKFRSTRTKKIDFHSNICHLDVKEKYKLL